MQKLEAYRQIQNEMGRAVAAFNFRQADRLLSFFALDKADVSLEYADDLSLLKEAFKNFSEAGAYDDAKEVYRQLPEESKVPLVRFFYAEALAHTGDLAGAEAILLANGGIVIPDIREGENSTSAVYVYIQQEKARREGRILKGEEIGIPFSMDLRMTVPIPENRQKTEKSKFI